MKLGIIGYGTIASLALKTLARSCSAPLGSIICLSREGREEQAQTLLASCTGLASNSLATSDFAKFQSLAPDLVIEAAGHQALGAYGPSLLRAGIDLIVTSVGALSDEVLERDLTAASATGGRLILCSGAVGGLDILQAAKLSGLTSVTYVSRKAPKAWQGTKAQDLVALEGLQQEVCFYEGTARGAARDFPQNANVAATLALNGAGFEKTRVRLIADPATRANVHEVAIVSACVNVTMKIEGVPSPDNPKTSLTTAYSLASDVLRWIETRKG